MKKTLLLTLFAILCASYSFSQGQAEAFINEALGHVKAKKYKEAQLSLQDAISELNNALAADVLKAMPIEINGLNAVEADDNTNSAGMSMMGGGIQISRKYQSDKDQENYAEVGIIANSPLMSSLSMYLSNPAMLSGSGQKSIRVGTRRAIMSTSTEESYDDEGNTKTIPTAEVQIPLTSTLITIKLRGFADEAAAMAFVNKLDIEKIKTALGE